MKTIPPNLARLRSSSAFTLIELLLVITILSTLMGLLWASLRAVRRYSREVATRTELANLEAAFHQYYNHYGKWPIPIHDTEDTKIENGDTQIPLNGEIIDALSGKDGSDLNPDRIPFFEVSRIRDNNGSKAAVNAWGTTYGAPYHAKFDTDGDNSLTHTSEPETIPRSVIVWTEHPDHKNDHSSTKRILGSWQQ